MGTFKMPEVSWIEDELVPVRPVDLWFQQKYGYREWLSWLDAGEPEKFTIIYDNHAG